MNGNQQPDGLNLHPSQETDGAAEGQFGVAPTDGASNPDLVQPLPSKEDLLDDADPVQGHETRGGVARQNRGDDRRGGQERRQGIEDAPETTPNQGSDTAGA
jgi:hypothetical protein